MSETKNGDLILVVANRTASTHLLLDEVRRDAKTGASFTVCIPPEHGHHHGSDWSQEDAQHLMSEAAGAPVDVLDPGTDAVDTIHDAVHAGRFDAIIVSTPPEHLQRWVHHDLPHRIEHLGLPVRIVPPEPDAHIPRELGQQLPNRWSKLPLGDGGGPGW
jgi:hypothetical protein